MDRGHGGFGPKNCRSWARRWCKLLPLPIVSSLPSSTGLSLSCFSFRTVRSTISPRSLKNANFFWHNTANDVIGPVSACGLWTNYVSHDYPVKLSTDNKPSWTNLDFDAGIREIFVRLQWIKRKALVVAVQSSERKGKNLIRNVTNKPTLTNNLS